ncbi:FG-GAP-like repeat-containing protein, partial [Hymenobacter sp. M29]
ISNSSFSIATADVNGDGKPDLLTPGYVRLNTTAAGAATPSFAAQVAFGGGGSGVTAADVNGDGKPDLLVANSNNTASVVLNTTATGAATPSFAAPASFTISNSSFSIATADVNGDGKPDLLTPGSVLLNTTATGAAAPSFAALVTFATGSFPIGVAAADVNSDGKPDLLVANNGSDNVSVVVNTTATGAATASFAAPVTFATGLMPYSVATADVNGDGKLDLLTPNSNGSSVSVLLNTTVFAPTLTSLNPTSGSVGTSITLTGTNLTGATAVRFNGTAATTFAVVNATTVTATVPAGATSGNVTVTTGGGTSNGLAFAVASLATVATAVPANVTTTSATLGGSVTADGGATVTDRGVVYSTTNTAPTTADTKAQNGTGTGTFSQTILGLTPSAMYYVRAYATNGAGTSYGTVQQFRTIAAPTVTTATPAAVATTSATLGGTIVSTNGDFVTSRGVVYSATNPTPSTGGTNVLIVTGTTGTGTFSQNVTGLQPGTLYYVQAYGTNSLGTRYGGVETFTTVSALPTLTSLSPTSGSVGTSVTLTGTNLTGATGVRFNGTAAITFAVVNATTVTATVPAGATSGNVTVTTPGGTSNGVAFAVTFPDLVIDNTFQAIAPGTYNSITVRNGGAGELSGNVVVNSFVLVQGDGSNFDDNGFLLTGAGTFTLGAGAELYISSPAGISASGATGAVRVTGTRTFSTDARYMYYASVASVTGSGLPARVRSIGLYSTAALTLSQPLSVAQKLTFYDNGNLITNGQMLTLLSSAAGTALVANDGTSTGVVSGTVTVQRYIDPALNPGRGYRHYSSPVANTTVADLTTSGFTPGLNTAYNTSPTPSLVTPFPTVYAYDQSRLASTANNTPAFDKGWVVPAAATAPLVPGRGYSVNLDASQLVDFVGTLNGGNLTVNLTRNAGATAADAGWALLGNPYPAPLDLSALEGNPDITDIPGLDQSFYVFQSTGPYVGQYRSYINNIGNPLVPVAQGFFARVSAGQTNGSFHFRNAQRVTDYATAQGAAFQRSTPDPRPRVQLDLAGAGLADVWTAYAQTGASAGFDRHFDAVKLPNSSGLNLSSAGAPDDLAIDGRPAFTAATVLPLSVGVPAAGTYTFTAAALANLPAGLDALLADAATGQMVNLRTQPSYGFVVTAAQAQALLTGRFTLQFAASTALATAPALTAAQVSVYPNPAHDRFSVLVPAVAGATQVQATLLNALGQVVGTKSAAATATGARLGFETSGLAPGVYTLRLRVGGATLAKRVVIQ